MHQEFGKLACCPIRKNFNHWAPELRIEPRLASCPGQIFEVVFSCANASEPILYRVLRVDVLAYQAVDGEGQFSFFQSTSEVVKHKALNIRFLQLHDYSTLVIPWYSTLIYCLHVYRKQNARSFSKILLVMNCKECSRQFWKPEELSTPPNTKVARFV